MNNAQALQATIFKLMVFFLFVSIPNFSSGQERKSEKSKKSFFTIETDSTNFKEYNSEEIRRELDEKEGLLKINIEVPKWEFSKEYSSETLKGKLYVLDFWGSWCAPCIKAMPKIQKLHEYYKAQDDVLIIGVSAKERSSKAAVDYFKKKAYSYVHIPNGDLIADAFKVQSFPTVLIIDKKGLIIDAFLGFQEEDFERVKKIINKNL